MGQCDQFMFVLFGFYFGPMPRDSLAMRYFSNYVHWLVTPIVVANKNFNFEVSTNRRIVFEGLLRKYPKDLTEQYGIIRLEDNVNSAHLAAAFLNERLAELGDGSIDFTIAYQEEMLRLCAAEIMIKENIHYDTEKWGTVDLKKIPVAVKPYLSSPWIGRTAAQMRRDKVAARLARQEGQL